MEGNRGKKRSFVWNHFTENDSKDVAWCHHCEFVFYYNHSSTSRNKTSKLLAHLRKEHPVFLDVTFLEKRASETNQKKRSIVWDHFSESDDEKVKCHHCERKFSSKSSGNLLNHLRNEHSKFVEIADSENNEQGTSKSRRPSLVWKYFDKDPRLSDVQTHYVCKVCGNNVKLVNNLHNHLKNVHPELLVLGGENIKKNVDNVRTLINDAEEKDDKVLLYFELTDPQLSGKDLKCKHCSTEFTFKDSSYRRNLARHIKTCYAIDEEKNQSAYVMVKEEKLLPEPDKDSDFDAMLMASFEAEMKQQMMEEEKKIKVECGSETSPENVTLVTALPSAKKGKSPVFFTGHEIRSPIIQGRRRSRRETRKAGLVKSGLQKLIHRSDALMGGQTTDFDHEMFLQPDLQKKKPVGSRKNTPSKMGNKKLGQTEAVTLKSTAKGKKNSVGKTGLKTMKKPKILSKRNFKVRHTIVGTYKEYFVGQKSVYGCHVCKSKFDLRTDLIKHLKYVHRGRRFSCDECPSRFSNHKKRIQHISIFHRITKVSLTCTKCDQHFSRRYSLKLHECLAHGFSFPLKGRSQFVDLDLDFLEETHDEISCCICDKNFETEEDFQSHRSNCSYGGLENHKVDKKAVSQLQSTAKKAAKKTETPDEVFKCPVCSKIFPDYSYLKMHVDKFHNVETILAARKLEDKENDLGVDLISCTVCDSRFFSIDALNKHFSRRHDDATKLDCEWWTWNLQDEMWIQHPKPLSYHI